MPEFEAGLSKPRSVPVASKWTEVTVALELSTVGPPPHPGKDPLGDCKYDTALVCEILANAVAVSPLSLSLPLRFISLFSPFLAYFILASFPPPSLTLFPIVFLLSCSFLQGIGTFSAEAFANAFSGILYIFFSLSILTLSAPTT